MHLQTHIVELTGGNSQTNTSLAEALLTAVEARKTFFFLFCLACQLG